MGLLSYCLWGLGDGALLILISRAQRSGLLARYRFFYAYIYLVLGSQIIRIYFAIEKRNSLAMVVVWWILEFITALAGLGVTWEVYRQTLSRYDGVRRMARAVLTAVFLMVLAKAMVELASAPLRNLVPTTVELDRNLRVVQALLLLTVLGLIVHYAIPLGRNLWSMLIGYGLLIGSSVITLTLTSVFAHLSAWKWWGVPPQLEYCATLMVWCAGLWSYAPSQSVPGVALERDYQRISAQTTRAFGRLRDHLLQPWSE